MSSRTFTFDEAQMLLPVLESLLKRAIQSKQLMEEVDGEFQETAHRVFLNGGTQVNVVHLARRKAEREKAIQRIKDTLPEIEATGVQVKDLERRPPRLPLPGGWGDRAAVLEAGRTEDRALARRHRGLRRAQADR